MGRLLKSYFFWTYSRGSFHYDVMVTLILAFIFITPQFWNYGDKRSSANYFPSKLVVQSDGANGFVFEVKSEDVKAVGKNLQLRTALRRVIEPLVGGSVQIERYELVADANGTTTGYRVWAHR
jgi:hypothetical protein